jgi:hypothetical protein
VHNRSEGSDFKCATIASHTRLRERLDRLHRAEILMLDHPDAQCIAVSPETENGRLMLTRRAAGGSAPNLRAMRPTML